MSKLAQRLKNISGSTLPAVGFRAAMAPAKLQGPVLIAMVPPDTGSARAAVDSGAEAVLAEAFSDGTPAEIASQVPNIPCGLFQQGREVDFGAMKYAGLDFLVFSPSQSPASWLKLDDLAKIIKVHSGIEPHLLRSIDRVDVDAVLIHGPEQVDFVSVEFLMNCLYVKMATNKPVLAMLPSGASAEDVVDLWNAGIDGFVIAASPDVLKSISNTIGGLGPRTKRKDNKTFPLVPQVTAAPSEEGEDEEE